VHHVGIPFDVHQRFDLHRPPLGDPAHVVPAEVDEHDVFGALLCVGQQPPFELRVFFGGRAPTSGPCDRAYGYQAVFAPDENLR